MSETNEELAPAAGPGEAGYALLMDDRTPDGRFATGNPGKPGGARHRVTRMMESILEQDAAALARKAVELGRDGDIAALRLCLERLAPVRRDSPVAFDLPPIARVEDAERASSAVIAAVAVGDLSPAEAHSVMALLVAHKGIVEAGDHERRLAAIEAEVKP